MAALNGPVAFFRMTYHNTPTWHLSLVTGYRFNQILTWQQSNQSEQQFDYDAHPAVAFSMKYQF